jgi:ribosomal protein L35
MKTNKSFTKRLKVTKSGKVIARKPGINHFNAKASRNKQMNRKRNGVFHLSTKQIGQYMGSQ